MRKRIVFAVAVVVVLVAIPALAGAELTGKGHRVQFSGLTDTLSHTGVLAVPGSKETDTGILRGTISGRPAGPAAFYQTATWHSGLILTAKGRVFNTFGSIKFTGSVKFMGSATAASYTGSLKITGGTGRYRNVQGTLHISGTAPTPGDPDAATVKLTGKLTY